MEYIHWGIHQIDWNYGKGNDTFIQFQRDLLVVIIVIESNGGKFVLLYSNRLICQSVLIDSVIG